MDVARLIGMCQMEELTPEDVFYNTTFQDFVNQVILKQRNSKPQEVALMEYTHNDTTVRFPNQVFLGGIFVDGTEVENVSPVTGKTMCKVHHADVSQVNEAVEKAQEAFSIWSSYDARKRGRILHKLADLMEENKNNLAAIESIDSGAVYSLAQKTHVGMSIQAFRYFAGWSDKIQGKTIPINQARPSNNLCFTKREPLGVVGIIIPWNYPLMMLSWKVSAALAAGNCVVIKPAQVTPLSALEWARLTTLAGIPPGVVSVLNGSGRVIGKALAEHPMVKKIGFTGSTEVGKTLMQICGSASILKKVSLELGGKSPLIICEDADLNKAVSVASQACFFNKGENCIAAGRIFIHSSLEKEFIAKVVDKASKMKMLDPFDPSCEHGPQNHQKHLTKLLEYIQKAKSQGCKLEYGGNTQTPGYYLQPTIFSKVSDSSDAAIEESFGPIMLISTFDSEESVIARANATDYGLASGVLSQDISKCLRISDKLNAGTCFINCYNKTDVAAPFGGFGNSGFGKDLGDQAILDYTRSKTVTIQY